MFKKLQSIFVLLLIFSFSAVSIGNEWANYYFPDAVGSYWVYEDQNGDEVTRYAIEPEDIDGETYRVFSYDPPLEDWANFEHYVNPYFYQIGDDWVAFFVGDEIENAIKAATMKQMEELMAVIQQQMQEQVPEGLNISFDLDYDVEAESQDYFYFLPTPATFDEEWPAVEINVVLTMTIDIQGAPMELPGGSMQTIKTFTTLVETGNVTGTETVETGAGTFEDCLVIEYRTDSTTETVLSVEVPQQPGPQEQNDVTVTTIWLAPNVGIVKFEHVHEKPEQNEAFGLEGPEDQTLELIRYEITGSPSEGE